MIYAFVENQETKHSMLRQELPVCRKIKFIGHMHYLINN
jgi:hypothetical protein